MEFQKLIEVRRSIRKYATDKKVTKEELMEMIGAAQEAPSWKNTETGRYYCVQVIAKLAVLVRNLEPKQGRIREEHDLWNEKWIIAHVRRTLISYGLYESGKS